MRAPATSALTFALSVLTASGTGIAAEPSRAFTVTSPPMSLPLVLKREGGSARARIDLPAVEDTIVLGAGRLVQFFPNGQVPAVLESEHGPTPVTVRFDAASAVAEVNAHLHLARAVHVIGAGEENIAHLEVTSDLDVFGLSDEVPHVKLLASAARATAPFAGPLAGTTLARDIFIATPSFPLELAATGTSLALTRSEHALAGQLVLDKRLSPGAVEGEAATRIAVQLFDERGHACGELVTRVSTRSSERWESDGGAASTSITWARSGDRWIGAVHIATGDAPAECDASRARVTLGDETSPFVVQASGALGSREVGSREVGSREVGSREVAGVATHASTRLAR